MNLPKLLTLLSLALLPTGKRVAAADDTASRLAAIHARLLDAGSTFSVRAVLAELDGIEPLTAPNSAERGRVMQLRAFVETKGDRTEDATRHGEEALRIEASGLSASTSSGRSGFATLLCLTLPLTASCAGVIWSSSASVSS